MALKGPIYVYVVNYGWDYAGEETQAVYATRRLAEKHPPGADSKEIYRMKVQMKVEKGKR